MQANFGYIVNILKMIVPVWSLLVLAIDAAFIAKWNSYYSYWRTYNIGVPSANAVLAACIFNMLYFAAALYFIFYRSESIFVSMIVDTCCIGFLFLLNIGCVGSMTSLAAVWGGYNTGDYNVGPLSSAVAGLGWIMVVLILAILVIEVTITLQDYGMELHTWKTPFNQLLLGGGSGNLAASRSAGAKGEESKMEMGQTAASPEVQYTPVATHANV